jgi:two-component system phosphate regulon sensor histidine kinase PhoR
VPLAAWLALLVVGLVSLLLAWRYFRLSAAIRAYRDAIQADPRQATTAAGELTELSRVIRLLVGASAQQQSSLMAERDRLGAVLNQMTDGVLIADSDGVVQYSNPAAAELFQVPEPLGKSVTAVLRNHRLVDGWQRSRGSVGPHSESVEIPGTRQFLQLIVVPDRHAGGSLLLVQDLTRVRRLETVRQDFVANVSHELKTPLASIKAMAETLQGGAWRDPEAGPRFMHNILDEVDRLAQVVEELLQLSSIESGTQDLNLADVDPASVLQAAAERMRPQTERAKLRMRVECPDGIPRVRADPARLEVVLMNLIHNSIKFTPPGGYIVLEAAATREGSASANERDAADCVMFSVIDTGQGISADELARVFERFYRTDRARRKGGTGLGLSIAKHIVEAHGGRIGVESREGHGTTFHFTVPLSS